MGMDCSFDPTLNVSDLHQTRCIDASVEVFLRFRCGAHMSGGLHVRQRHPYIVRCSGRLAGFAMAVAECLESVQWA